MRIFFLFLLILNLLFAGWQYYQPEMLMSSMSSLPDNIQSVMLLSEQNAAVSVNEPTDDEDREVVKIDEKVAVLVSSCFTLGPFRDEESIKEVEGVLQPIVKQLKMRTREEKELHRYWVYLPAMENRQLAIAKSKELAKHKIKDYYIVRSGENNNSISLGHFREKNHAERRKQKLKKAGFDAELEMIYRTYNLYWLDYSIEGDVVESDSLLASYIVDGVAKLSRKCE